MKLHVRTVNSIRYGDAVFTDLKDSINILLADFPGEHHVSDSGNQIVISRNDFEAGIDALQAMTPEQYIETYPDLAEEYTRREMTAMLWLLLSESDPSQDTVALDWF